ncbi:MAG TPA: phage holin family protein [Chloroflexi bacterium]|nr:phage holin family protein [Chloroflexota bacterium]
MIRRGLLRWLINALAIYVASKVVSGIYVRDEWAIVAVALILGLVNAFIRPLLKFFTCPLIVLTLGLFLFVINAAMLGLTAWVAGQLGIGFEVAGFGAAFWGALVISLVSLALTLLIRGEER